MAIGEEEKQENKTFIYLCPDCNYAQTELQIEMSRLTKKIDGRYYTYCPRCHSHDIPVDEFKIKQL